MNFLRGHRRIPCEVETVPAGIFIHRSFLHGSSDSTNLLPVSRSRNFSEVLDLFSRDCPKSQYLLSVRRANLFSDHRFLSWLGGKCPVKVPYKNTATILFFLLRGNLNASCSQRRQSGIVSPRSLRCRFKFRRCSLLATRPTFDVLWSEK